MEKTFSFIGQPYPYYYTTQGLPRLTGIIFLLCFCFIFLFQPFNVVVGEHKMHYVWICLIHAGLSAFIFFGFFALLNLSGTKEDTWNIGKEMIHLSLVLVFIGVGNFLIRDVIYDNPGNWSTSYLFEEVRNTFLVGILLILILVPLNFMRVFYRNSKTAEEWTPAQPQQDAVKGEEQVQICTKVKADDFQLKISELLFARADGNYVELHLAGDRKLLKRLPMKELEEQLKEYPEIIKTHRSFLVNTSKITEVSGNAQGYQLKVGGHSSPIPVARGMVAAFRAAVR